MIDRHKSLIQCAKIRAILRSQIHANFPPLTMKQICELHMIKELGVKDSQVSAVVWKGVTQGIFEKATGEAGRIAYRAAGASCVVGETSMKSRGVKERKIGPADVKIDIIKSTGKVRLTISGLVIEIGVES